MPTTKRPRVGLRAELAIGSLAVGLVVGIVGLIAVRSIRGRTEEVGMFESKELSDLLYLRSTTMTSVEESFAYVVSGEASERTGHEANVSAFQVRLDEILTSEASTFEPEELAEIRRLGVVHATMATWARQMFVEAEISGTVTATTFARYEGTVHRLEDAFGALIAGEQQQAERAQQRALETLTVAERLVYATVATTIGMSLLAALWFGRRIVAPLRILRVAARELSEGRLTSDIEVRAARELSDVAAAFNDMARRIQALLTSVTDQKDGLENILDAMREMVLVVDPQGQIVRANAAAYAALGFEASELLGRSAAALFEASGPAEATMLSSTGARIPVALSRAELRSEHGVGTVWVAADLSERRTLEGRVDQAEKLAAIGGIAAGVGHEVNNPLAYIIANLTLLKEHFAVPAFATTLPPDLAASIDESLVGAERIRVVVRDLKLFSRTDESPRQRLDVVPILESAAKMASNEIRHRARLSWELEPVPVVLANEHRLAQVFLNIIVNAAQAIPDGQADRHTITIRTRTDGAFAVIEIQDTGGGMTAPVKTRLFEPFFTTKAIGVGTGLGLSICDGIVASLGGHIEVDSAVGRGTTIRVRLPAHAAQREEAPAPPCLITSRGPARVLVIDDDVIVGTAVRRLLGARHDVESTTDAAQALTRIAAGERFDVIFCDVSMPVMSGRQFHESLRSVAADQMAGVVFLTGGAFTEDGISLLSTGGIRHLQKPCSRELLLAAVDDRLGAADASGGARAA